MCPVFLLLREDTENMIVPRDHSWSLRFGHTSSCVCHIILLCWFTALIVHNSLLSRRRLSYLIIRTASMHGLYIIHTVPFERIGFVFELFLYFFCYWYQVPCVRLSTLSASFCSHVNIISSHIMYLENVLVQLKRRKTVWVTVWSVSDSYLLAGGLMARSHRLDINEVELNWEVQVHFCCGDVKRF